MQVNTRELTSKDLLKNPYWRGLPPIRKFHLRSSSERFGAAHTIWKLIKSIRPYCPRSFANWQHGWVWWNIETSEGLMFDESMKEHAGFITSSPEYFNFLKTRGYLYPYLAPLPFFFSKPHKATKQKDLLIAFPIKSAEMEPIKNISYFCEYLDFLETVKNNYEYVLVSIFSLDFSNQLKYEIERRGLSWVIGACPNDYNSLDRIRFLLESSEYSTMNCMSSSFVYSLFSRCKTSISGPYQYHHLLTNNKHNKNTIEFKNAMNEVEKSHHYAINNFQKFFLSDPSQGLLDYNFAHSQINPCVNQDPRDIATLLGWNYPQRFNFYFQGARRRLNRFISV